MLLFRLASSLRNAPNNSSRLLFSNVLRKDAKGSHVFRLRGRHMFTGKNVARKSEYKHFNNNNNNNRDWITWTVVGGIPVSLAVYYVWHLERAPLTGRLRMIDISPEQEQALGIQSYRMLLAHEVVLPDSHPASVLVRRVGLRVAKATGLDLPWEFRVIQSPIVNAACLPGGKIVVFTGLLQLFQYNEEALAVVLAHECAHALARHQAEQMGFVNLLLWAELAVNLVINAPFATHWLTTLAGRLPYSRKLELEADHIGLQLLAKTCHYRPSAMPLVLDRLAQHQRMHHKANIPHFLSTHPSDTLRLEECRRWLPEAETVRSRECSEFSGFMQPFDSLGWPETSVRD